MITKILFLLIPSFLILHSKEFEKWSHLLTFGQVIENAKSGSPYFQSIGYLSEIWGVWKCGGIGLSKQWSELANKIPILSDLII